MGRYQTYVASFLWLLMATAHAEAPATDAPDKSHDEPIPILLGAENSWPPYSDELGQGISTRIITSAFAKTGLTPQFKVLPYARVLHDLASGKIDGGYNVTLQASTKDRYIFGEVPLVSVASYWFFLPGTHPEIKSIADIPSSFRVGVIRDYEYGDIYENHRHRFSEVRLSQQSQIIRLLKQGRIDAAVMFDHEAASALKNMQLDISIFDKRFLNHQGDVYLAFSPKNPKAHWLAGQFDKGLRELKQTGEYEQLLAVAHQK
jgi:polar amino acid transport system substrate-binding protein